MHVLVKSVTFVVYCQGTTNILISVACQPPAGYNLIPSVDKYYKSVRYRVTWQEARDACSSEGTMLVELRTAEEYQAIRPIFGIFIYSFIYPTQNNFSSVRTCIWESMALLWPILDRTKESKQANML